MALLRFLSRTVPASICFIFFFFNDTATTEIYTLSLHDALPICKSIRACVHDGVISLALFMGAAEAITLYLAQHVATALEGIDSFFYSRHISRVISLAGSAEEAALRLLHHDEEASASFIHLAVAALLGIEIEIVLARAYLHLDILDLDFVSLGLSTPFFLVLFVLELTIIRYFCNGRDGHGRDLDEV